MYFIWVARGLYSSMNTMFTFVYQVVLYRKQSPAGQLLHTANALKRLRKLQLCLSYRISRVF